MGLSTGTEMGLGTGKEMGLGTVTVIVLAERYWHDRLATEEGYQPPFHFLVIF
jgi:hypothetical protein